jgi:hypothetical protein
MNDIYLPIVAASLIMPASIVSIRLTLSVAVVEMATGVIGHNLLHMHSTAWMDFPAGFGGVLSLAARRPT